tara:strand:+ start:14604 stop:14936 length:333 start_codon:yes stop_codon:yes gene_type:complete
MTGGLEKKRCIPCEGGIPPLSDEESNRFLDQINEDWILVENHHIERIWKFDDFRNALDFVNSAGEICEEENHHADFELGWGRVKVMIWTHKINGLAESDFILAAKFDSLG